MRVVGWSCVGFNLFQEAREMSAVFADRLWILLVQYVVEADQRLLQVAARP